nr:xylulose kinase-1 [Tanacetum cinerariifolium]
KDEYETWAMKMEYWIMNTDHNLWKVIQNENSKKSLGRYSKGVIIILPPVLFEEHVVVQRETKARTLLLQSLSEDHMADFHHLDDAREIWLAVKAQFGVNEESKKMRKTMLKQEFFEFRTSEEEGLHKGYDRSLEIDVKDGSSYGSRGTVAPTHSAFIGATSTTTKMGCSDQPSYSSSITYTSAHSGSLMKDVLQSFIAENKPIQQLVYEDFEQPEEGEKVYGLMAGFKSDFVDPAVNTASSVYDVAVEFAMMGISPKAKIEKNGWEVKLVESLARFDKWKASSKNLAKLINSSMTTRTKLGLGFKEYFGLDEVFDLSTPSIFDPEPVTREVKSLYERFVKAGDMHEVPPSITRTFMPTSSNYVLEETQVTFGSKSPTFINTSESNDFVSCDNSDKSSESETHNFASCVSSPTTTDSISTVYVKILPKSGVTDPSPLNGVSSCSIKENVKPPSDLCNKRRIAGRNNCKNNFVRNKTCFVCGSKYHLIKDCHVYDTIDNFSSVVLKATSIPAGSRNSSASTTADRFIPAASKNRSASIYASRSIPAASRNRSASIHAGRFIPAASRNRPASIHAGRSIPAASRNRPASIHAGRHILASRSNKPAPFFAGRTVHPHVNKDIGIVDSGCSRSMTGNKEKLTDFV